MKPIIYAIAISILMFSCEKKSEQLNVDEVIAQLLVNNVEDDEALFNLNLLKSAQFVDSEINDSEIVISLFQELKAKHTKDISFVSLTKKIGGLNLIVEDSSYNFRNSNYSINIYIPNIETSNPSLSPIIAVGSEIEDSDESDQILGWFYNESGEKELVYLSEKIVLESLRPIFIINSFSSGQELSSQSTVSEFGNQKSISTFESINATIDEYKISYRYETSNRSEYSYELGYIYTSGEFDYGGYREEIREIHKDDINKLFTTDFPIWQLNSFSNVKSLCIVTFEYDWYASLKPVSLLPFVNQYIGCRMKHNDEWYQVLCFELSAGTTAEKNTKGFLKVKM